MNALNAIQLLSFFWYMGLGALYILLNPLWYKYPFYIWSIVWMVGLPLLLLMFIFMEHSPMAEGAAVAA